MHDAGWKNSYFTYSDFDILGQGCSFSQYPQFYVQQLENYQLLPRPYIGSSDGNNEEKRQKKNGFRLFRKSRKFVWEGIIKISSSKYWQNMTKCLLSARENTPL